MVSPPFAFAIASIPKSDPAASLGATFTDPSVAPVAVLISTMVLIPPFAISKFPSSGFMVTPIGAFKAPPVAKAVTTGVVPEAPAIA